MLYSSGIDFIATDDTNLDAGPSSAYDDVLQVRPAEIIFETFTSLNKNGTNTPKISVWNKAGGIEYQTYLQYYNTYSDIVYTAPDKHDNNSLKMVYFVPNNNQTIIDIIQSNSGKNNIQVIWMWGGGGFPQNNIKNGSWTFFYPCIASNGHQTTSMESLTQCNFVMTEGSSLGTQISASFTWQNNYGSLPFSAANKLNGRTFQIIIKDCLNMKPDNVLIPSFNEHSAIGFAVPEAFGGNNTWSNGLFKDKQRSIAFVDTYGSEVSRSFEPVYCNILFRDYIPYIRSIYSYIFRPMKVGIIIGYYFKVVLVLLEWNIILEILPPLIMILMYVILLVKYVAIH